MYRYFVTIFSCCFYLTAFASEDYFACPNSINYVHLGDSIDQVIQTCGKPDLQEVEKVQAPPTQLEKPIEEWVYDYVPNSPFDFGLVIPKPKALIVHFQDTQVIEILVEGKSVQKTTYCRPDLEIKIGDSMQTIYQICQWPTTDQTLTEIPSNKTVDQLILVYKIPITNQSAKLTFSGTKLADIKII